MKFKWYGASEFLITTDNGTKILTDPFQNNEIFEGPARMPVFGNQIRPTYTGEADIVTISHPHGDHDYIWNVQGVPRLYAAGGPQEYNGIKFTSVATLHGNDTAYINNFIGIEADGIRIWHTGDNGQVLSDKQLERIGRVDILMTNWDDETMEMPHEMLDKVLRQLNPKIVIPMHHCYVDEFMTNRKNFIDHRKDDVVEVEFKKDKLPSEMTVVLFKTCNGNPLDFFDPESYKGSALKALYK